jgi:L-arabinose isomerase
MQGNPQIGLILMRAPWAGCGAPQDFLSAVQADARAIVERLRRRLPVRDPWIVSDAASLEACKSAVEQASLDLVILAFQTWTDESLLLPLLDTLRRQPLVLWCSLPWRRMPRPASFTEVLRSTGPVSAFRALGALRGHDVPFLFTWGSADDPRLQRDLEVAARAANVGSALRNARFGIAERGEGQGRVGGCEDDERVRERFGLTIERFDAAHVQAVEDAVPGEQVLDYLSAARVAYPVIEATEAALERSARAALGLARLAADHRLQMALVQNPLSPPEAVFPTEPGLYPGWPGAAASPPEEPLFLPEGDLCAGVATYVLHRLTGSPTLFLEFWYWDEALNQLVGGHAGPQNPAAGEPGEARVGLGYQFCKDGPPQGAQLEFIARPGRVTLFQLRAGPGGWQGVVATGVCLESRPVVEGVPHALLRLDTPIAHFLNRMAEVGASPHWILAYGSVAHEIEAFCQMHDIPLEILR